MSVLSPPQRKVLEDGCVAGRIAAEQAARAAIGVLAVAAERPPAHLSEGDRALRRGLRAKARQLGDTGDRVDLLVADCAYEHWHRLLFARFLAENGLLVHPEFGASLSIEDCDDLAEDLGEPDGWSVAARFAAQILPGIFRVDDPCVQVRLATEGRLRLEGIVSGLPPAVFGADDALGWVYQFWQKDKKDEVNLSERKIGGAELGPVTQLFTENYMVRFLLENSLGAWWAGQHPESPLAKTFDFLRLGDDGRPVASSFESWPERVGAITVMDPCCGSGHFLVEAFSMLWQMRSEEEGLAPVDAQDAVLRDNLFGLELDRRCVQIAMFALALKAWKDGGGWRQLPTPNIACSGIPVKASVDQWKALADGDVRLENALARLHILFRDADDLGSLIDPRRTTEFTDPIGLQGSLDDEHWEQVASSVRGAADRETSDPATAVFGQDVSVLARASDYLTRAYTLVVTNPPFLAIGRMGTPLRTFVTSRHPSAKHDLATVFLERYQDVAVSMAMVLPENWLHTTRYEAMRRSQLTSRRLAMVAWLGARAFQTDAIGTRVRVVLLVTNRELTGRRTGLAMVDVATASSPASTASELSSAAITQRSFEDQLNNPDARIISGAVQSGPLLSAVAESRYGLRSGDSPRLIRKFWELPNGDPRWRRHQSTVSETTPFGGREDLLDWSDGKGALRDLADAGIAALQGREAWGKQGVAVSLTGVIRSTLYEGTSFDNNCAVIWPKRPDDLPALWAYCSSPAFHENVRAIDDSLKVMNATLLKVPFDVEHWREIAEAAGSLPEPRSDDPTQWLFEGQPEVATSPLQVAAARLLGYRWPQQHDSDDLEELADDDGVVCLPSVRGERTAAERVQELLARAFGGTWSPGRSRDLLTGEGSTKKDLDSWLRDEFFKSHCQVFKHRPFIWHIWDGRKDGFSALVNYHRLDRPMLQKLTYSYLGDWIERQTAAVRDETAGAEARLAAAQDLQRRLDLILDGEPPYDIYVRWKPLAEQPVGWEPDLNDGVRVNVRPFVEADVLRAKFNVKWEKDRGKNPDGSERVNDLHFTHAQKLAARKNAG